MDDSRLKFTKPGSDAAESGVDHFSKLPNELLQRIFALAYAKKKPSGPLSRRLRPFYDALKFSKIAAHGAGHVRSLYEKVTARPAFGSAVREISLVERASDTQLGTSEVQTLFGLLPSLRILPISVSNSASWLEAVFPTRQGAETVLRPSIELLHVASSDAHGAGYDAKVLDTLNRLPHLDNVLLDFPGSTAKEADTSMAELTLPNIKHLQLGLHGNALTIGDFVACFPHLQHLSLQAHMATCDFSPAVAGVAAYKEVRELCLGGRPPLEWRFPEELAKFVALEMLSLDGNFAHVGTEAYGALRGVPITMLQVKKACDVSAAGLETLLGPRGSCPTLKVLQLDNLSAACPRDFCSQELEDEEFDIYDYADDVLEAFDIYDYAADSLEAEAFLSKFTLPRWTTQFSPSAYDQLARTAKSQGVVVKGSTVTARKIEIVYRGIEVLVEEMTQFEMENGYWLDFEVEDSGGRGPIFY